MDKPLCETVFFRLSVFRQKRKRQQELHIEMESNKRAAHGIPRNERKRREAKKKKPRKRSDTSIKCEAIVEMISANEFTHTNGIFFVVDSITTGQPFAKFVDFVRILAINVEHSVPPDFFFLSSLQHLLDGFGR